MSIGEVRFIPQGSECPICCHKKLKQYKARAFDSLKPEKINIIECINCKFAWQYPQKRSIKESIKHFQKEYKDVGKTRSKYYDPNLKEKIANIQIEFLSEFKKVPGTLLDIGAGSGKFAEIASHKGWNVTAIDPALDVNSNINNQNIKFIKGTLDNLGKNEKFDAITLWDVIEHIQDPARLLYDAKKYLKTDGWIFIETGNYKSVQRIKGGPTHWMYQLDHKWYFAPDNLELILKSIGYSNMTVSGHVLRPGKKHIKKDFPKPSIWDLIKSMIKKPSSPKVNLNKYFDLKKASNWEKTNLSIFTIAGKNTV